MNDLRAPRIRDPLEIEVPEGPNKGVYFSRVQDITEGYIAIDVPKDPQGHTLEEVGCPLKVRFHGRDLLYEFESELIGNQEERIPLTLIKKPGDIHQIERRRDYRVECLITVECQPLRPSPSPPFKATIVNISAGGIRISSRVPLEVGCLLRVVFDLPRVQAHCEVQGKIVHVLDHPPSKRFLLTMFWEPDKRIQTRIYRFTMLQQIELRRKGLLLSEAEER